MVPTDVVYKGIKSNSGFDPEEEEEEEEEENRSLSARGERDNKYVVSDYEQRRRRYLVSKVTFPNKRGSFFSSFFFNKKMEQIAC